MYARSKLWDPTLVLSRSGGGGEETQMVSYNLAEGGVTFMHPIRKRQTETTDSLGSRRPAAVLRLRRRRRRERSGAAGLRAVAPVGL